VVVLDMANLCSTPVHQPVSALVYSGRGDEVDRVYVDGALLVADGHLTSMDEARIRARSAEAAHALTSRAATSGFAHRPWRSHIAR
jgi:5-methylthioadenosine/S-adenosylhomocysteine deaminase